MKSIKSGKSEVSFTPIQVTLVIESQVEYDALVEAARNLTADEIHEGYDEAEREVWVRLLDCIAKRMRGDL